MKWLIPIILLLLTTTFAFACSVQYETNQAVTILDSIESQGLGSDCNLTVYNNQSQIYTGWMNKSGLLYTQSIGGLENGEYTAGIECNKTINSSFANQYLSECKFNVQEGNTMLTQGIVILGLITIALVGSFIWLRKINDFIAATFTWLVSFATLFATTELGISPIYAIIIILIFTINMIGTIFLKILPNAG
jgi:hypothetical protein